ncbi:DUF6017 domain-containing protein [Oribacterium sp. HCP3S3_B9]|uniref:DUF6017 domain-containing protein n=1 Tax=Oribacterium sp. HCP3S3_B9 TaxID=3438946 RepID=UPI003F8B2C6D
MITDDQFADITTDAKLLYSLMLDRSSLSAKNGWLDKEGKVYIFYTLEQIMTDMHCANQKATKLLKELETKGLIERKKRGQGKVTRIYVRDFATGLHGDGNGERQIETHENHDSQTHENRESRDVEITSPDSWKSCTNNTHINNIDMRKTDPIHLSAESANPGEKVVRMDDPMRIRKQYEDYLMEKLRIDVLIQNNPCDVGRINEIFNLMLDVLCSTAKTIRISGDDKPIDVVRAQFMKIDSGHMEYILDCFKHQITDIRNVKQYLLATIYNAPLTIDHYYTSKLPVIFKVDRV